MRGNAPVTRGNVLSPTACDRDEFGFPNTVWPPRRWSIALAAFRILIPVPAEPTTPVLTDSQRRIVGSALTLLAFLGSIALLILAFIVLARLLA